MAIADVLVYVDNDKALSARVRACVDLCTYYKARLKGVYSPRRVVIPAYAGPYIPQHVFDATEKETDDLQRDAQAVYEEVAAPLEYGFDFHCAESEPVDSLNILSRLADLVVVPQRIAERDDLNFRYDVPDVLIGSACPVLLLPPDYMPSFPIKRAMIAWDGGRESARAFHAALPLLADAEQVNVVRAGKDGEQSSHDFAQHISRHGLNTDVHILDCVPFDEERTLLNTAKSLNCDLLIMGAYGHSRFREFVLGGATKYAIQHAPLPVLFSH
ncbi:MAG: universal stress protein [Pseudomonadota bacterium]